MSTDGQVNKEYDPSPEEVENNGTPNESLSETSTGLSPTVDPGQNDANIQVVPAQPAATTDEKPPETKKEEELPPVGFFSLFRYLSCCDTFLIVTATLVALASGASTPAVMIIYGQVIDQLIKFDASKQNTTMENSTLPNATITTEEFLEATANLCMWNAVFGVSFFVCNYIMVSFFSIAAANQAFRIRCRFMQSVLRQDMAWYDTHQTGDFATRITGDLSRVQEGTGEKVGICISFLSSSVLCMGSGLYYGWKLALVILTVTPVMTIATAILTKIQASVSNQEMNAYGTAGAIAEEVISSIRTVVAFGGQKKEIDRYEACLIPASKKGVKRGLMTSLGSAITSFCIFAGYALAFWYGVKLIVEDPEYTGGKLIIIFFNVMFASMFIGQTAPYFEAFALAKGAAGKIFSIIEREPDIDSSSDLGNKPDVLEGHIRLNDVHFKYPARPTVPVLRGLNLEVKPGETVAVVGSSGCGKSTIVQLLLRFYDTQEGSVELDGIDVKDLHLGWLRDRIGLVGQEPVLFSTTIEENIRMGRIDATPEDIELAAKTANAHDFIQGLPKKYQTNVGDRGTQLSGGQKQRIAIARAIVRNPRILLLDEATSALDTESEAVVQAALDVARRGRTTVVVAHRLSTIRTADKIVVLDEGVIKETGTHEELMEAKGLYYQLVITQTKEKESEEVVEGEYEEECGDVPDQERRISIPSLGSEDDAIPGRRLSTDRLVPAYSGQISTTSGKGKEEDESEDSYEATKHPKKRLWTETMKEWPYILIGCISSIIMGLHFPGFGIIFGSIIGLLSQSTEVIKEQTDFYCFLFMLMAITSFVFNFLQVFMFTLAGEKLTFRLRKMVFANIITQDISFFDDPQNSVGSLCSRLNSDASAMQGATGSRISTVLQALSTMAISVFIGIFYYWKIGLVVLAFVPLVVLASTLEARVVSGHMHSEKLGVEKASKVATEAIENIRTVASLHRENTFYNQYCDALWEPHKQSRIKSHVRGLTYGFAQGITSFAYAATMYYGSILVARDEVKYADLLKILQGVLVGAMRVGNAVAFMPDYEKARVAAIRIFSLLDIRPTIDPFEEKGLVKSSIEGSVDFLGVHFSYPTRPQQKVLQGLEASIQPGITVALVGTSGCGKSTCVQLLERFYDPSKGKVMVDFEDIRGLNVANHRSHLALVSQEPVLFGGSIADNIAYGDNTRMPDMTEIIAVARQANIHGFISSLPQGYDTPVGDRGTQLSGGQKQRIAIARALIRNPRVLLLDEATSALDTENEKAVQEALDQARNGRTCIVIAHRLTTVQSADVILVIHRGKIVEQGTHQELINKKGVYYNLYNTQG